jgi:PhnB protein
MAVKPIPEGYHTITPYLVVEDAAKLVEFIENVFDGRLLFKLETDDGKISHGEFKIGDSILMFAEASEEWKPTRTLLHLYVEDADAVYQKALDAGANSVREPQDQFYGDRSATVQDSFGNFWGIATHIEDVSEEEMAKRISVEKQQSAESKATAG